ncbi:MAG TPA: ATP-binding cassette domain-containing protein [Brumimicrobium sp.]|nr:ATP-binding cassette domain-containing protein [Brumimicrobium sp.]
MSERILRALMQLFAIIARVDEVNDLEDVETITSSRGRKVVKLFLGQELNASLVEEYLKEFDQYLNTHHGIKRRKDGVKKRTSVNSVKILRICSEINQELTQRQKIIVLVRIIEFILTNQSIKEQEIEFVNTVSESFNVNKEEYNAIFSFVKADPDITLDSPNILYISPTETDKWKQSKQIVLEGLEGLIGIMKVDSVNLFFLKYIGKDQIILNGQVVAKERQHIFNPGSSIRTAKTNPIYYSDVISRFLNDGSQENLEFRCDNLVYKFPNKKIGLHDISFAENNGALIGIMGGSGAGKSTLLNVLNGNYKPASGSVKINGIDIHKNPQEIEGVIGFISQDDLLIEELTVFQNLYFNAQLCFDTLSNKQISKKVVGILKAIGLFESKDLKVGSPMEKTISGGQRKRLNIALELIREPSVLFVDEPTSGLSSRDSENIMDLLKELALKGKLVFVVIHQPSSDIFKMFDRLMILDQGGYPIFYGNPVDSVVHFKTEIDHANCDERECPSCGNVNPEQIFNIIEAKVVDEFGNLTIKRKISPEEWNKRFIKARPEDDTDVVIGKPHIFNKIPNRWKQFKVYFKRDILSKLTNTQYILLNTIEAPALALILGFFVKYFGSSNLDSNYTFESSENLPQFLFIAVVVALFLGLTVAAEEIIKDQKILKRESFLNLSKSSYIFSKISIMFIISAIQTAMFVLIGNYILEIRGMWFEYWLILFSTSCFANLLGLNISATFNSAKVIYILIPIMIIPQLLFSGVIVKFDKLHPLFSKEDSVPWVGNIMASRWAYEGLAVTQYKRNDYEAPLYSINRMNSEASWKRDYWLPELRNQQNMLNNYINDEDKKDMVKRAKRILIHEIEQEERLYDPSLNFVCKGCVESLKTDQWTSEINGNMSDYFNILKSIYMKEVNESMAAHVSKIEEIGIEKIKTLKRDYFNESLSDLATNRNDLDKIIIFESRLIQKADPIYNIPIGKTFFDTHFYAPGKNLFGAYISTFYANLLVIWAMSLILAFTLYFNFFRRLIALLEFLSQKMRRS